MSTLLESTAPLLNKAGEQLGPTDASWAAYRQVLGRREKPRKDDPEKLAVLCRQLGVDSPHLELHCLVLDEADRLAALAAEFPDRNAVWKAASEEARRFDVANYSQCERAERERRTIFNTHPLDLESPTYRRLVELEEAATRAFHARNEASEASAVLEVIKIHFPELFEGKQPPKSSASRRLPASIGNAMNEIKQAEAQKGRDR